MTPNTARFSIFLLSFGSIWALLGATWRLAPMHVLGVALTVPTFAAIVAIHAWIRRAGHQDLHRALVAGWWGGWWGTLGYDVIRIPFHLAGYNPFAPIRSYGMFLVDAPHATLGSDLVGVAYHFSNGLTFGVMYAAVMYRRHWAFGVLFGLWLETLAVVTPFGAIYHLRTNAMALFIAYFAHLYYGFPLGAAVGKPEWLAEWVRGPRARGTWIVTSLATIGVVGFLTTSFEPPFAPRPPPATVDLGPDAIVSGWTRVPVGTPLVVRNRAAAPVTWSLDGEGGTLEPGATATVTSPNTGIHQLKAEGTGWRSAFVSVERDGYPREP